MAKESADYAVIGKKEAVGPSLVCHGRGSSWNGRSPLPPWIPDQVRNDDAEQVPKNGRRVLAKKPTHPSGEVDEGRQPLSSFSPPLPPAGEGAGGEGDRCPAAGGFSLLCLPAASGWPAMTKKELAGGGAAGEGDRCPTAGGFSLLRLPTASGWPAMTKKELAERGQGVRATATAAAEELPRRWWPGGAGEVGALRCVVVRTSDHQRHVAIGVTGGVETAAVVNGRVGSPQALETRFARIVLEVVPGTLDRWPGHLGIRVTIAGERIAHSSPSLRPLEGNSRIVSHVCQCWE